MRAVPHQPTRAIENYFASRMKIPTATPKAKGYPEIIASAKVMNRFRTFKQFDEAKEASKYAKRIRGQFYSVVDRPGTAVAYEKGYHFVNNIGYAVVKK